MIGHQNSAHPHTAFRRGINCRFRHRANQRNDMIVTLDFRSSLPLRDNDHDSNELLKCSIMSVLSGLVIQASYAMAAHISAMRPANIWS